MPWKATDVMKERTKFVLEWERRWNEAEGGPVNMAELCRMFGVSRQTGYTWVARYREGKHDLAAVVERSRRPKTSPFALSMEMEDLIVAARKRYPRWGARKLHAILVERNPDKYVPSASAIAKVLMRRGLTKPRRRRRRGAAIGITAPFSGCEKPNDVWCIDFKGWFLTDDGLRCYPLTSSTRSRASSFAARRSSTPMASTCSRFSTRRSSSSDCQRRSAPTVGHRSRRPDRHD